MDENPTSPNTKIRNSMKSTVEKKIIDTRIKLTKYTNYFRLRQTKLSVIAFIFATMYKESKPDD